MASAPLLLLLSAAALLFHSFAAGALPASRDPCLDISPAASQRCGVSSIRVRQTNRGRRRGGAATMDPVFEVEVENRCCCAVSRVVLVSEGFASSVPVDPRLFRRDGGGGYLVADGGEIPSSGSLTFRYAWDRAFRMYPASLESNCSAAPAKQREAISIDVK